jgi:dihydroflavonol-4-reductase
MTTVFVTGANGFIGSHLVKELLDRGYHVNCLVRASSDLTSLRGLAATLYIGDVRDPATLIAPMQGVDYVYHLAAQLMVTSRDAFEQANTYGTQNMLEAAERHAGPALKRFLYVSSQAAAGPGETTAALDETALAKPISWYGLSKKQAEDAVNGFSDRLPVTIVRPSSVYGERETDISQVYPLAARRLQPKLGLETKYAVMVYVGDLVHGFVAAAESDATLGQTYFLNHPQVLTSKDIIQTVARAIGKPWGLLLPVPITLIRLAAPIAELTYEFTRSRPPLTRDKGREIAQRFWIADPAKAKRDFDWQAQHDLLQGMQITTRCFLEEEQQLREMRLEDPTGLWLKYLACALLLGGLIEMTAALGHFYTFQPWWAVFVIVFGAFGLGLGTIAFWLRQRGDLLQFAAGTITASVVELLNDFHLIPFMAWAFAPGWPLGITNPWARSLLLGCAGGIFILIVNAVMRLLYKRRLRKGS